MVRPVLLCPLVALFSAQAQQPHPQPTQLTIYNGDFAVARTGIALDLHAGTTEVLTTEVTSKLEPDSVVLRDPAGHTSFRILEQNYDAGVVNQQWLLDKYEGKTLAFRVANSFSAVTENGVVHNVPEQIVQGRVVRAGQDPLIEVDGHLQFQLPGTPLFPAADSSGLLLKPTLRWQIQSDSAAQFPAELDYITHGMSWQATYNVVLPENANADASVEKADVLGWVTIQNNSGTDFPQATVQLMAGDVAKLPEAREQLFAKAMGGPLMAAAPAPAMVTQKTFDDFHLYDLHRTVALRDGESKQVQFLEASEVSVNRTYQYNGNEGDFYGVNTEGNFGNSGNRTVAIREEIVNKEANHLGMPLPAGRLRLYRRENSGQMQFVGESEVPHTPADQHVELTSGNAFDLTGERRQTTFHVDGHGHTMEESFEIKLSNAKEQAVTVHDVEHLNRAQNWKITSRSTDYTERNSDTVDFAVVVPAKGSQTVTYTVHYSW